MRGYHNDIRPEKASVVIPKKYVGSASNDVGFVWNNQAKVFDAIVSEYDQTYKFTEDVMNKLRQKYAYIEIKRRAKSQGYCVTEQPGSNGTIRLQLARR
jgi:hypothetical protein